MEPRYRAPDTEESSPCPAAIGTARVDPPPPRGGRGRGGAAVEAARGRHRWRGKRRAEAAEGPGGPQTAVTAGQGCPQRSDGGFRGGGVPWGIVVSPGSWSLQNHNDPTLVVTSGRCPQVMVTPGRWCHQDHHHSKTGLWNGGDPRMVYQDHVVPEKVDDPTMVVSPECWQARMLVSQSWW